MRLCRGRCRYAAQDRIPIFFSSCRKENGHSWSKEKTLGMSWPPRSRLTQNEGPAGTDCRASPEPTYRLCRDTPFIIGASPHLKARRLSGCKPERLSATAPCVPLRYALPGSANEQKRQRKQEQGVSYLHPEASWGYQHGVLGWTLCAPRPCHAGIGKSLGRTVENRIPQTCAPPQVWITLFLFHRARRIFFLVSQKENGGCIWDGQSPSCERPPLRKQRERGTFRTARPCNPMRHRRT